VGGTAWLRTDITSASTVTIRAPLAAPPQDRRFDYPALRRAPVGSGDLAVGGFTVSFTTTGLSELDAIERAPTSTEPKAELDGSIGWESKDLKQFAVVLDDIPVAVLNAEDQLRGVLEGEMSYRIDLAVDAHVISQIEAAAPPSGSTGTGLIQQVRTAVAASRALRANPTTLLLNPSDAATLDLTTASASGEPIFATRASGSASPLWDLQIRESESITDPILLEPRIAPALRRHRDGARRPVLEARAQPRPASSRDRGVGLHPRRAGRLPDCVTTLVRPLQSGLALGSRHTGSTDRLGGAK
jgi:hypothetical protein